MGVAAMAICRESCEVTLTGCTRLHAPEYGSSPSVRRNTHTRRVIGLLHLHPSKPWPVAVACISTGLVFESRTACEPRPAAAALPAVRPRRRQPAAEGVGAWRWAIGEWLPVIQQQPPNRHAKHPSPQAAGDAERPAVGRPTGASPPPRSLAGRAVRAMAALPTPAEPGGHSSLPARPPPHVPSPDASGCRLIVLRPSTRPRVWHRQLGWPRQGLQARGRASREAGWPPVALLAPVRLRAAALLGRGRFCSRSDATFMPSYLATPHRTHCG